MLFQGIDDSEITCMMPTELVVDSQVNLDLMTAAIRHARLSGLISRKYGALKSKRTTLQELRELIDDLSLQLNDWWQALPEILKSDMHNPPTNLPRNVHLQHIIWNHFAYYGSLVTIHSIAVHPWNTLMLTVEPHEKEELARLVATSTEVYVTATRNFINNFPRITINSLTPKWYALAFFLALRRTQCHNKCLTWFQARLCIAADSGDQPVYLHSAEPTVAVRRIGHRTNVYDGWPFQLCRICHFRTNISLCPPAGQHGPLGNHESKGGHTGSSRRGLTDGYLPNARYARQW